MKKDRCRTNQKWISGIAAITSTILFIIFLTGLAANAQVPLYYPPYPVTSYFNPYAVPVYYPAPAFINYAAPVPAPAIAFSAPSTSFLRSAATTTAVLTSLTPTITTIPTLTTTPAILTPTIASLLINTGNPQVQTILALASLDPTLLDYPLLLNALINTGNSQVALILALLSL